MARPQYAIVDSTSFGAHSWMEERILDEAGILRIELEDEAGAKIIVSFSSYLAFRKMDEGDALHTLQDIEESSEPGTRLYVVADSEYLRMFHFESENLHKAQSLVHYCLTTVDSVIDVISFDPPTVSP